MIDEIILRRQLAKPGLLPWMESYFDTLREHFTMVEDKVHNMSFIDVSSMEDFKKSIERFQKENPDAKVYATAFVFDSQNEPKIKEECICCPTPCSKPEQEIEPKPKKKSKRKK